jgi:hypothetical protein
MKPAGRALEGKDMGEGELEDRGESGQCAAAEDRHPRRACQLLVALTERAHGWHAAKV